jgi:hypothetical protein
MEIQPEHVWGEISIFQELNWPEPEYADQGAARSKQPNTPQALLSFCPSLCSINILKQVFGTSNSSINIATILAIILL